MARRRRCRGRIRPSRPGRRSGRRRDGRVVDARRLGGVVRHSEIPVRSDQFGLPRPCRRCAAVRHPVLRWRERIVNTGGPTTPSSASCSMCRYLGRRSFSRRPIPVRGRILTAWSRAWGVRIACISDFTRTGGGCCFGRRDDTRRRRTTAGSAMTGLDGKDKQQSSTRGIGSWCASLSRSADRMRGT